MDARRERFANAVPGEARMSESEYAAGTQRYVAAAQSLERREEKIDAAAEEIEKDLYLLGATAIEDKLQTGVPDCIEQMMSAGIAVGCSPGISRTPPSTSGRRVR